MQLSLIVINDPIADFEDGQRCYESLNQLDIEKEILDFLPTDYINNAAMKNAAISQAKYDLICFVNMTETLSKEFPTLLEYLKSDVVGAVYSDYSMWYSKANTTVRKYLQSYNRGTIVGGEQIQLTGTIFKKQYAELFNEKLEILEDWHFWLNLSRKRSLHHVPISLKTVRHYDKHIDYELIEKEKLLVIKDQMI